MDRRDQILEIVSRRGPVLPSQINKELNVNIIFASAMLSELVDVKKLRLSHVKVGGSPLYFVAGQESKLVQYRDRLHEKEQRAFDLLKEKRVILDIGQEPVVRVALREMKDFAVPLEVTYENQSYIFWKWYLLSNQDAEPLIKEELEKIVQQSRSQEQVQQHQVQQQAQEHQHSQIQQAVQSESRHISKLEEQQDIQREVQQESKQEQTRARPERQEEVIAKVEEIKEEKVSAFQEELLSLKTELQQQLDELRKQKEEMYEKQKQQMERQERLHEQRKQELDERKQELEQMKKEIQKERDELKKQRVYAKNEAKNGQQKLVEEEDDKLKLPEDDEFFDQINRFFKKSGIEILEFEMIRKNSEMDMVINLPTNVGSIRYYCKAKSKQKVNEGDLSTAYVKCQSKKLPGLFLTTGDITKRASEMLDNEFKNMHVKKL